MSSGRVRTRRTPRGRVVLLGRAVLDHRFWVDHFPPGRNRTPVTDYLEDLGGPAAVASVTVARMGGSALLIGRRGDDAAGARVDALLRSHAVNTRHLRSFPGARTPVAAVLIGPGGERFMFPYAGARLPDAADWLPVDQLDRADAALVDLRWPAGAAALTRAARERGLPVVVDLDIDTVEAWRIAAEATHAVADEELAARCGGAAALLERLAGTRTWGAVTLGASGVVHAGGHVPAFVVTVRDSTGAGDVFHGAFVLAIAERQDEDQALRFASAAAALRCQLGRVPVRAEVEQMLTASKTAT